MKIYAVIETYYDADDLWMGPLKPNLYKSQQSAIEAVKAKHDEICDGEIIEYDDYEDGDHSFDVQNEAGYMWHVCIEELDTDNIQN